MGQPEARASLVLQVPEMETGMEVQVQVQACSTWCTTETGEAKARVVDPTGREGVW